MYQEGSRTRFGIISLLKKRSSLLKPLKSEKEPFFTALFHFRNNKISFEHFDFFTYCTATFSVIILFLILIFIEYINIRN